MPENEKPWWASKTVWSNAIMVVAAVVGSATTTIDLDAETQATILAAVMGVVNLILRFATTTKLTK